MKISLDRDSRYVAAIDIGTNSIHLLVASVDTILHTFNIETTEKRTTRLGEKSPDSNELTELAINRALEALKSFKALAESYKVDALIAVATSAVREASNGKEFLQRVREELQLEVDLISGIEEARLIYLGVLSVIPFNETPHLLIDIGGGSTELILADERDARALTSSKVGAVRLQVNYVQEEPIPSERLKFLKTFIKISLDEAVEKVIRRIKKKEQPLMVATSGTAMAIGGLLQSEENIDKRKIHGSKIKKQDLNALVKKLASKTFEERCKSSSLNPRRAEIIVPGALILQSAMEMLNMEEVILCERSLREGVIFDWMIKQNLLKDRFSFQSTIRTRTVLHQVRRFGVDHIRAERVARHSMNFYEKTIGILHTDGGEAKELLWAAAMLHACGKHINLSAYHKHSWYLIRNGELLGYSNSEHLIVACIARYHRRSLPKKKHLEWQLLGSNNDKKIVSEMSLLLRLAVSLERRAESAIQSITCQKNDSELHILLKPVGNDPLDLEKLNLMNCSELIRNQSGLKLKVSIDI